MENYDVAIIGGGPVGIFTAYYAGLRNLKVALIESLEVLGGQASALYPQKRILDIAGFYEIGGQELVNDSIKQMNRFEVDVLLDTTVENVQNVGENDFLLTTNKADLHAKTVILATGVGSFTPRPLVLDNADELENVDFMIKDVEDYRDKTVLVLGGGDSAVDFSNMLDPIAEQVTLVHRRDQFRALERSVIELQNSGVDVKTPLQITAAENTPEGQLLVTLSDESQMNVDKLLVAYGFKSSYSIIDGWDIQPEKFGPRFLTDSRQETSVPGVFAVGDAAGYPGKADLIATGYGEAPTAVNEAINIFDPDRGGPAHSTSLNV
ncbi:MAG: NAD(P)/FAD-dependent oxidoreductase [Lactobacillaceae bacterium]|jgi:thioredoxin reductase (NADPH)|nr:NAD(P)/FAD-dependent oxidoreductase [Lactobacillaceae bacterium]